MFDLLDQLSRTIRWIQRAVFSSNAAAKLSIHACIVPQMKHDPFRTRGRHSPPRQHARQLVATCPRDRQGSDAARPRARQTRRRRTDGDHVADHRGNEQRTQPGMAPSRSSRPWLLRTSNVMACSLVTSTLRYRHALITSSREPVLGLVSWLQSNWSAIRRARDRFDARQRLTGTVARPGSSAATRR